MRKKVSLTKFQFKIGKKILHFLVCSQIDVPRNFFPYPHPLKFMVERWISVSVIELLAAFLPLFRDVFVARSFRPCNSSIPLKAVLLSRHDNVPTFNRMNVGGSEMHKIWREKNVAEHNCTHTHRATNTNQVDRLMPYRKCLQHSHSLSNGIEWNVRTYSLYTRKLELICMLNQFFNSSPAKREGKNDLHFANFQEAQLFTRQNSLVPTLKNSYFICKLCSLHRSCCMRFRFQFLLNHSLIHSMRLNCFLFYDLNNNISMFKYSLVSPFVNDFWSRHKFYYSFDASS